MEDTIGHLRSLVAKWAQAVREEDMAGILANHAEDMVMFDVPPPFQSAGIELYEKTWHTFFAWSKKAPRVFEIRDLSIWAGDTAAFGHGIGHCSGVSPDGADERLEFRFTVGFRKINGVWTITHEHHSVPAK